MLKGANTKALLMEDCNRSHHHFTKPLPRLGWASFSSRLSVYRLGPDKQTPELRKCFSANLDHIYHLHWDLQVLWAGNINVVSICHYFPCAASTPADSVEKCGNSVFSFFVSA